MRKNILDYCCLFYFVLCVSMNDFENTIVYESWENATVEYKTGKIICLDKGFYTDSSSEFKAIIEDCVD